MTETEMQILNYVKNHAYLQTTESLETALAITQIMVIDRPEDIAYLQDLIGTSVDMYVIHDDQNLMSIQYGRYEYIVNVAVLKRPTMTTFSPIESLAFRALHAPAYTD